MKKTGLLLSVFVFSGMALFAQNQNDKSTNVKPADPRAANHIPAPQAATPAPSSDLNMKFTNDEHSFGNIPEGPSVSYDFEFKNIGKEPIVLSNVQASCGCTTPTWPKEPIAPGKSSKITATFNTQGRPGQFNKTITVTSNVGTKVLRFTGTVEKAPESSVPSNNSSIMKH